MSGDAVIDDLRARGLLHDHTDEAGLRGLLAVGPVVLYHGIDPTRDSLHVGNLVGVMAMRRFQDAGHRPLLLLGGATGMVGDPSGRSSERNLMSSETLAANIAAIRVQLEALVDFEGPDAARLVNNLDWTRDVTLLDFLRDIGKHVTVNQMLAKDSVRTRMAGELGISFTEFSYMLLQAFDFNWLFENFGCRLQLGGSDQWGNITAGVDLVRRINGTAVHGLTWPLMTRADGAKFGKTAEGAVWLDPGRTLPYELHQYFVNTDDRDVERLLLQLTMLPVGQVGEIMADHERQPHKRRAQHELADEVCALAHGAEAVRAAKLAAGVLFGRADVTAEGLESIQGIVPETAVPSSVLRSPEPAIDALTASGVCSSRSEARRAVESGGVRVNGVRVGSASEPLALLSGRLALLQHGRKHHHLLTLE